MSLAMREIHTKILPSLSTPRLTKRQLVSEKEKLQDNTLYYKKKS